MMGEPGNAAFIKFLSDGVKRGVLRRVAKGLYESTLTPPDAVSAIYKIIQKLRGHVLSYISLESQLSLTGDISQVPIDRVTVMTRGRSGIVSTPYGVIEFIHTKRSAAHIMRSLYFDPDIRMYRATTGQALADLKSCRRNLHMLED